MLVKISFDGNNKIQQQCVMNDKDCSRIAEDAGIHFEIVIDIFYNKHFLFEDNEPNLKAADQLQKIYPKPSLIIAKKLRTDAKRHRDVSIARQEFSERICNLL